MLDVSAVSLVIVIIAICDMPRQEFSLCERVYIHNTYMKSRKWCSETGRKFRVKFPGRPVPDPSTIRRQANVYSPRHEGTRVATHERDGDNIAWLQHLKCTSTW